MQQNTKNRLGGIVALVIAAGAAWFGIYQPLQSADAGAGIVRWMPRITVLISLAFVFGVFFSITGARYPYRNVEKQTLTPVGWVLFGIVAVISLVGYFWMDVHLKRMGYHY